MIKGLKDVTGKTAKRLVNSLSLLQICVKSLGSN